MKVSVLFRGRNILHPELGRELLERIIARLNEDGMGQVERSPGMEGRFMTMTLAPGPLKPAPKQRVERVERAAPAEAPAAPTEGAMAAAMRTAGVAPADGQ